MRKKRPLAHNAVLNLKWNVFRPSIPSENRVSTSGNTGLLPAKKRRNMSNIQQSAQQYWDERSDLFGDYYIKPTLFDKIFRKGVYTRASRWRPKLAKKSTNRLCLDIGSGPGINSVTFLKNSSATKSHRHRLRAEYDRLRQRLRTKRGRRRPLRIY